MVSQRAARLLGPALVLLLSLSRPDSTAAQSPANASSSAFGESVHVRILPLLGPVLQVTSGPLPTVSGNAAPAYNYTQQLASAKVTAATNVLGIGAVLQAGLLQVDAESQVPATNEVFAAATVAALQLKLAGLLPFLGLQADAISSRAQLVCPCTAGQPAMTATSNLANAQLNLANIPSQPTPNTVLVNLAGLRVVLNEQILTVSGSSTDLTVNAIHITLDVLPVQGLGLVSGEIIVAQSRAHLTCTYFE
jgi:hypothetical protein